MKKAIIWALVAVYIVLIIFASSYTGLSKQFISANDKILHFIEFFILSLILFLAFKASGAKYPYVLAILIAISLGILTELIQIYVPGRSFSIYDIIADILGAVTILIIKLKK